MVSAHYSEIYRVLIERKGLTVTVAVLGVASGEWAAFLFLVLGSFSFLMCSLTWTSMVYECFRPHQVLHPLTVGEELQQKGKQISSTFL